MGMDWAEDSHISSGGTELMGRRIEALLPADLLDEFQIMLSRFISEDPDKIKILWTQAAAGEPNLDHLANGGWRRYERIVFVSNWQANEYVSYYNIPQSLCYVIPNAITPLPSDETMFATPAADRPVRLIYTSNPSRGLLLLYHAFRSICELRDDVELDVYSSFGLYGWYEADRRFDPLYDLLRQHPKINYHGSVPNDEVRAALRKADVFAYPSMFPETSCLALIEAMSAGLACVHSDYAALRETAAGHTFMYPFKQDISEHATDFRNQLLPVINAVRVGDENLRSALNRQKTYADQYFDVDLRVRQWVTFLQDILATRRANLASP